MVAPSFSSDSGLPGEANENESNADLLHGVLAYLGSQSRDLEGNLTPPEAWQVFYRTYRAQIRQIARSYGFSGQDLDDCEQDIWQAIMRRLPQFPYDPRRGPLRAWLTVLIRRSLVDRVRRLRRTRMEPLTREEEAKLLDPESDPATAYEQKRLWRMVREALDELKRRIPEKNYLILHLRWIEGCTLAEIAAQLDLTPNQVRFRNHRLIRRLRKILRPNEGARRARAAEPS